LVRTAPFGAVIRGLAHVDRWTADGTFGLAGWRS
jgi:hypothetical protein